jgi:molybdopterin synthase sulfur carrier subunit
MRIKVADSREAVWIEFADDAHVDVTRALYSVKTERPELLRRWGNNEGELRDALDVFINGENIRYREGMGTELRNGDEVYVISLIAGG